MSKVSDADVEAARDAYEAFAGVASKLALRAALEAVSSIHEAEPEGEDTQGLTREQLLDRLRVHGLNAALYAEETDEAYEIGKRDGYSEAVQDIDQLTGGDGEYRVSLDLENGGVDEDRHTPDAESMKRRIVDRFAAHPTPIHEAEPVGDKSSPEVKAICDTLDFLRRGEHEPYWLDARDGIALMGPLLRAATKLDKLERAAHPAPISKGVTVKAMEWDHRLPEAHLYERWHAQCLLGEYRINLTKEGYCWYASFAGEMHDANSLDDAKAAAQADFDARVKSCLSHTAGEIE